MMIRLDLSLRKLYPVTEVINFGSRPKPRGTVKWIHREKGSMHPGGINIPIGVFLA